jgi:type IV secretion system protein VirD4
MPPETIRTLPFGTALVLLRSAPPLVTDLRPWTARNESARLGSERASVEATLRRGTRGTPES